MLKIHVVVAVCVLWSFLVEYDAGKTIEGEFTLGESKKTTFLGGIANFVLSMPLEWKWTNESETLKYNPLTQWHLSSHLLAMYIVNKEENCRSKYMGIQSWQ